jgi:uncharacterized HAD superfamily protein
MVGKITGISDCESAEVHMVVIRANGSREDLGVVSYYNRNPLKTMIFRIKQFLRVKGILKNKTNNIS